MKYLTIIFFLAVLQVQAQNIQTTTIRWNSLVTFNGGSGTTTADTTTVISYPDHIEWHLADSTVKYRLPISQVNGSWSNISNYGQVTFEVDYQGNRGTVLFQRDADRIRIRFMVLTAAAPDVYELTITTTEPL
jgi:hypothetical protein